MQAQSNEDRVEQLYRTYGSVIYSRCKHLLRDDALAEDATQDIFCRVLRHCESAPEDGSVLVWIYRISTNHCLNLIRNRNRQAEPVSELPEQVGEHPATALSDRRTTAELLEHAPEKLRATAALYFVEGMQQTEIADTLRISRRTVVNRLHDFIERSVKFVSRDEELLFQ